MATMALARGTRGLQNLHCITGGKVLTFLPTCHLFGSIRSYSGPQEQQLPDGSFREQAGQQQQTDQRPGGGTATKLATLRKRTGFALAHCKKALKLNDHDYYQALEWLRERAQQEGWTKATKLENRETSQGLISVLIDRHIAAAVEINCETDFVSRTDHFKDLLLSLTRNCIKHYKSELRNDDQKGFDTRWYGKGDIESLPWAAYEGKTMADMIALTIGKVSENLRVRHAMCVSARDGVGDGGEQLAYYVHAPLTKPPCLLGKYAALATYTTSDGSNSPSQHEVVREVCQHIVGLNPSSLGTAEAWREWKEARERAAAAAAAAAAAEATADVEEEVEAEKDEATAVECADDSELTDTPADDSELADTPENTVAVREEEASEERLLFQKFLIDDTQLVGEVLEESGVEIRHFVRFALGGPAAPTPAAPPQVGKDREVA